MNKILLLALTLISGQLSAQCIALNCPSGTVQMPGLEVNSPLHWNESYWQYANGTHDLPERTTELALDVSFDCPGQTFTVRYLLFLDTDGDGIRETVVDSDNLPGFNNINFNNAANPNFSGGSPRAFDERPVGTTQKYGFAQQEVANGGSSSTFFVKWNTQATPGAFVDPKLPYGNHKIKWIVTGDQGEQKVCEYSFVIFDGKKPTVVCLNGLSVNIMPTQQIELFAVDFLQYVEDNVSPSGQIRIGIRKSGTGTNFPFEPNGDPLDNIIFNCSELGTQLVELWAIDEAGNADFCETYVIVQDNLGNCPAVGTDQPQAEAMLLRVAPNPFTADLQIRVSNRQATTLSLKLTDPLGREILRQQVVVDAGEQPLELPTAALPAGTYFLWIEDGQGLRRLESVVKR